MTNPQILRNRLGQAWRKVDGILALVCFGGTMLFTGYVVASWQDASERQMLQARIDSVRADMATSCNHRMSGITNDLQAQRALTESLADTLHTIAPQVRQIANRTDKVVTAQKQTAEKAANAAVAKLDQNTRRQIRKAVKEHR